MLDMLCEERQAGLLGQTQAGSRFPADLFNVMSA